MSIGMWDPTEEGTDMRMDPGRAESDHESLFDGVPLQSGRWNLELLLPCKSSEFTFRFFDLPVRGQY